MHQHSSFSKRYRFADKFFTADAMILGFGGFVYFGDYVITGSTIDFLVRIIIQQILYRNEVSKQWQVYQRCLMLDSAVKCSLIIH